MSLTVFVGGSWWEDEDSLLAARHYALSNGLIVSADDERGHRSGTVALTLGPSPFPSSLFQLASRIQPAINSIIDGISRDPEMLDAIFSK